MHRGRISQRTLRKRALGSWPSMKWVARAMKSTFATRASLHPMPRGVWIRVRSGGGGDASEPQGRRARRRPRRLSRRGAGPRPGSGPWAGDGRGGGSRREGAPAARPRGRRGAGSARPGRRWGRGLARLPRGPVSRMCKMKTSPLISYRKTGPLTLRGQTCSSYFKRKDLFLLF